MDIDFYLGDIDNDEPVANRDWPSAPRVGDLVHLRGFGFRRVTDVAWCDHVRYNGEPITDQVAVAVTLGVADDA